MNRTPTTVVHGIMPEEKFCDRKPHLSHLKVFGCIACVHIPDELRNKLDPKAEKCVFVGYSLEQKGYRCYNPVTHEMRVSRDVVFDEISNWYSDVNEDVGTEIKEQVVAQKIGQQLQTLSGPRESPSQGFGDRPWSDRLRDKVTPSSTSHVSRKGKEIVGEPLCMPDVSSGYLHVDADSDGSEQSLWDSNCENTRCLES